MFSKVFKVFFKGFPVGGAEISFTFPFFTSSMRFFGMTTGELDEDRFGRGSKHNY